MTKWVESIWNQSGNPDTPSAIKCRRRSHVNHGKTVFSQVIDFLPKKIFRQCVDKYKGNYKVRSFTCYDQYLCMVFAQLTYRESLRDIECCLRVFQQKLYHIGIRGKVSRSTIADANEKEIGVYIEILLRYLFNKRDNYMWMMTLVSNLMNLFMPWMQQ